MPSPTPPVSQKEGQDKLFDSPRSRLEDFNFGKETAAVFDDMLNRSVPLYGEIQRMVGELAADFLDKGSTVYDLGCSTGNTFWAIAHHLLPEQQVKFIGIDSSQDMLRKTEENLKARAFPYPLELRHSDLNDGFILDDANVVVMALTLQFVRPLFRAKLLEAIFRGLQPGGCLLLVEKIISEHSILNRLYIKHYYEMKRRHGYSEMEIAQKREALENVLVPYRLDENRRLLDEAGFQQVDTFFQWYNFAGIIALK